MRKSEKMNLIYRLRFKIIYKKEMLKNYHFYKKNRHTIPIDVRNKKVVLMGTPEYGNLGDHLIAYAELMLLADRFGRDSVLEITENDIRYRYRTIKKSIDKHALLVLQGGGNISDIWRDKEKIRKKILNYFVSNKIIIMPQTIYASRSDMEVKILEKYDKRVLICAREKRTYEIFKHNQKITLLCPDAAFYLWNHCEKYRGGIQHRDAIGICIRNDVEASDENLEQRIIEHIQKKGYVIKIFSTVKSGYIPYSDRGNVLERMFLDVSGFQLVMTDRLHAMIIAYLTGTPCIALGNANGKVEGCYEWIDNVENIYFAKNLDVAMGYIEELIGKENHLDFQYSALFNKIFEIGEKLVWK